MVERVEDLLLPNAVVQRIMKDAIPDGINIAKEARNEISRAASIFILYLTSTASLNTKSRNQKTMNTQDILDALGTIEMENFIDPLKEALGRLNIHFLYKSNYLFFLFYSATHCSEGSTD